MAVMKYFVRRKSRLLELGGWFFILGAGLWQIAKPDGMQGFHGFVNMLWVVTAPLLIGKEIYTWMKEPDEQQ